MTSIKKGGGIQRPVTPNVATPNQAQAPTTATPAADTAAPAPADNFAAEAGTATGARHAEAGAALPRSGWGDEAALRGAVGRARETLDAEVAEAGAVNFRAPRGLPNDPIDMPAIMPMYGMPVPDEFKAMPNDKGLKKVFTEVLQGRFDVIDEVEAKMLVRAMEDGRGMSKTERKDLQRILDQIPHRLTENALHIIDDALKSTDQGLSLKSKAIKTALKGMMSDFKIDAREATRLINAALDGRGDMAPTLTKSQKKDLETIRDNLRVTDLAKARLTDAIEDHQVPIDPPIAPMYGVAVPDLLEPLKDAGLRQAFDAAWSDRYIDVEDAKKIIAEAKDMGGLSKNEKADIQNILNSLSWFVAPEAKTALATFLGSAPDEIDIGPIITPMYGVPAPDLPPVDVDPIIRPMYGMPVDVDPSPGPIIRPMYGMPVGGFGGGDG